MKELYLLIFILFSLSACQSKTEKSVLIFSKTTRYYHESIPAGIAAIQKLGKQYNFKVDTTTDNSLFTKENLKKYNAIIFLSTTGNNLLDSAQKLNFQEYIRSGSGFVGIHSASASEKEWPWYGELVGAVFIDHPEPQIAQVLITNKNHNATKHLPSPWIWNDEWYNFKFNPKNVQIILSVDENTYKGGKHGSDHPVSWHHEFEGGRSFYTALGHFDSSFQDSLYLQHILWGIKYAMGESDNISRR
jgi:type 1 glutamine amidotransferase